MSERRHLRQLMTVRLSRQIHRAMVEAATQSGRSLTGEIEAALADALASRQEKERLKNPIVALSITINGLASHKTSHLETILKVAMEILQQRTAAS